LRSETLLRLKLRRAKGGEKKYMEFVLMIVFGAAAGWLASLIMGTNARQGMLMDIVLGIVGAVVGGFVLSYFGQPGVTGFNLYSLVVSTLGAVLLIAIGRMFSRGAYY